MSLTHYLRGDILYSIGYNVAVKQSSPPPQLHDIMAGVSAEGLHISRHSGMFLYAIMRGILRQNCKIRSVSNQNQICINCTQHIWTKQ